jgi:hypothetical protein
MTIYTNYSLPQLVQASVACRWALQRNQFDLEQIACKRPSSAVIVGSFQSLGINQRISDELDAELEARGESNPSGVWKARADVVDLLFRKYAALSSTNPPADTCAPCFREWAQDSMVFHRDLLVELQTYARKTAIETFSCGSYSLEELVQESIKCAMAVSARKFTLSVTKSKTTWKAVHFALTNAEKKLGVLEKELEIRSLSNPAEVLRAKANIAHGLFEKHLLELRELACPIEIGQEAPPVISWHATQLSLYRNEWDSLQKLLHQ